MLRREIDPKELFRALFRGWYWIVLFIIGGGLFGLLFTQLRPPRYQAVAALRVDLTAEDHRRLAWPQKRDLLSPVRVLLLSDATLNRIPDILKMPVDTQSTAELRETLRLNDYESEWLLSAINGDPSLAAAIANAWAEAAVLRIEEAVAHAGLALAIRGQLMELGCEVKGGNASAWRCEPASDMDRVDPLIEDWKRHIAASAGIPADLTYGQIREASPPDVPIYWGRGVIILSGALLGLLLGAGLILARTEASARDRG